MFLLLISFSRNDDAHCTEDSGTSGQARVLDYRGGEQPRRGKIQMSFPTAIKNVQKRSYTIQ